jgi:7,8-dihydro-6-hydroxymethylpterin-pyrophosphokinase
MSKHIIFASIKTFSNEGLEPMRRAIRHLAKDFEVLRISSVYQVDRAAESLSGLRDVRKEERLKGLVVVFKGATLMSPADTLEALQSAERVNQKEVMHRSVSLNLLLYDNLISMSPGLAVPHPEMHLRPEEIVLINEIQSDIVHPVLGEKLTQLAEKFSRVSWGNFYAQGSAVL